MSKCERIASIAIAPAIALLASGSFYNQASAEEAWMLQNEKSSRCLDARDPNINDPNSLVNGTPIQLWDCNEGTMQQWVFVQPNQLKNVKSGRCLDATDPDPAGNNPRSLPNGTQIELWDCHGGLMQQWEQPNDDQLEYRNVKSGRCLDATDPDPAGNDPNSLPDATLIELWDCHGGTMQHWRLVIPTMPVNCDPALQISGLFLERYLGGRYTHSLGCPTSPEIDHPAGNGRYQTFEHGAMAYTKPLSG
jgi:hypothetical protein